VLAEFAETESGRRSISSHLMEGDADFVSVDMPQANRLTMHILTAVTEHRCGAISNCMKADWQQPKREE